MNFKIQIKNFSLLDTLCCGQCFRFKEIEKNVFLIFAKNNSTYLEQKEGLLFFYESSCCENFWKDYFNCDVDYDLLKKGFKGDAILEKLSKIYYGLRILKQDPFEVLISFILSINNNISRIKGIVEVLCRNFGEKIKHGYAFPTIDRLIYLKEKDLEVLKAGFRVKFLLDAIKKIYFKEVNLDKLYALNSYKAKKKLMEIYGVGEKVSSCVLLFGYNKMDSFPVDVWIKRVMSQYYIKGLTKEILSCPGLAQQLLFYGKKNGDI